MSAVVNLTRSATLPIPDFKGFEAEKGEECIVNAKKGATNLLKQKSEIENLIAVIDLTTLSGDDTREKVQHLVDRALRPITSTNLVVKAQCPAVCVYPARVADVAKYINEKQIQTQLKIASVAAGFPSGQYHLESRLLEIKLAVADGANEIDVVINRALALEDDWNGKFFILINMKRIRFSLFDELKQMREACGNSAHMKVILSVGELQSYERIYKTSWVAMLAGAEFIKTSTGKETVNATLEYAFVMSAAIRDFYEFSQRRVGLKPAGGIKSVENALQYRCLVQNVLGDEWIISKLFRIGASSLLDDIELRLK